MPYLFNFISPVKNMSYRFPVTFLYNAFIVHNYIVSTNLNLNTFYLALRKVNDIPPIVLLNSFSFLTDINIDRTT